MTYLRDNMYRPNKRNFDTEQHSLLSYLHFHQTSVSEMVADKKNFEL